MTYPYERLRLACGCHEVETAPGAGDTYLCDKHAGLGNDGPIALMRARQAILAHRIIAVINAAGIVPELLTDRAAALLGKRQP